MIVPAMTVQEIHRELFEDLQNLRTKLEYCRSDFRRAALKTNRYPYSKSYDCRTNGKRNLFVATMTAFKRSGGKKPFANVVGIYVRPEGTYAASLSPDINDVSIYPPHFFKRYRERIVKDDSISNEDIIKRYFEKELGFIGVVADENFELVYHCFENDDKEDKISFVAASTEGYCFGERQGNVNIVKTIMSEDMLFDNQKPLFAQLRGALVKTYKERYGNQS